ncbi:MAG: signal peptidase I [Candidatus Margulisiibacteriota bacterium]|jgi:signal peptidase I
MIEANIYLWLIFAGVICFLAYLFIAGRKKEFYDWLETVIVAGLMALIIITFIAQSFYIPSGSMIPTLNISDRVIGNKFIYKFHEPRRQDVIIFKYPGDNKTYFVKRLIGLPGDKVELRRGIVYVNDKLLDEKKYPVQKDTANFGPIIVSPRSYFALGDNRANSADSRFWGYVPKKNLVAQAMFTFWPLKNIKIVPQ